MVPFSKNKRTQQGISMDHIITFFDERKTRDQYYVLAVGRCTCVTSNARRVDREGEEKILYPSSQKKRIHKEKSSIIIAQARQRPSSTPPPSSKLHVQVPNDIGTPASAEVGKYAETHSHGPSPHPS